jgi:hypothetical protein
MTKIQVIRTFVMLSIDNGTVQLKCIFILSTVQAVRNEKEKNAQRSVFFH